MNAPAARGLNIGEKASSRPIYQTFGKASFTLKITATQLRKSTINANKIVRLALRKGGLIDFSDISPGEKRVLPCILRLDGRVVNTKASFLIPKRRGETSPEPRLWPYKMNKLSSAGKLLFFIAHQDHLEVRDSTP